MPTAELLVLISCTRSSFKNLYATFCSLVLCFLASPVNSTFYDVVDGGDIVESSHVIDSNLWPSISVVQLSPVSVPLWNRDSASSTAIKDMCCQTEVTWLGDSINYLLDEEQMETIIIEDDDEPSCSVEQSIARVLSGPIGVDAQGRKIGVAGRMQSIQPIAVPPVIVPVVSIDDDEEEEDIDVVDCSDNESKPSIVIQTEFGVTNLKPWKHMLGTPRDPRQRASPGHWLEDKETGAKVKSRFRAGSLVWAKLTSYPWWPAVVVADPTVERFHQCNEDAKLVSEYHVVFLDERNSRAWIPSNKIRPYGEERSLHESRALSQHFGARLKKAVRLAEEETKLSFEERADKYKISLNDLHVKRQRRCFGRSIWHGTVKTGQVSRQDAPFAALSNQLRSSELSAPSNSSSGTSLSSSAAPRSSVPSRCPSTTARITFLLSPDNKVTLSVPLPAAWDRKLRNRLSVTVERLKSSCELPELPAASCSSEGNQNSPASLLKNRLWHRRIPGSPRQVRRKNTIK